MNLRRLYMTIALIYVLLSAAACGTLRFKAQGTVESQTPPTPVTVSQPAPEVALDAETSLGVEPTPDADRILLKTIDP